MKQSLHGNPSDTLPHLTLSVASGLGRSLLKLIRVLPQYLLLMAANVFRCVSVYQRPTVLCQQLRVISCTLGNLLRAFCSSGNGRCAFASFGAAAAAAITLLSSDLRVGHHENSARARFIVAAAAAAKLKFGVLDARPG